MCKKIVLVAKRYGNRCLLSYFEGIFERIIKLIDSFLTEPVFRTAVHHAVLEAEAEVVHRLAQYGWRGPLGIEIGIAVGDRLERGQEMGFFLFGGSDIVRVG